MTARVIPFRPRRPRRVPARPAASLPVPSSALPDGQVVVEWDGIRGTHTAVCTRCTDNITAVPVDQVHVWADSHRCDPELAALLAEITGGTAA